jgi:hypothetical protein
MNARCDYIESKGEYETTTNATGCAVSLKEARHFEGKQESNLAC